MRKILLFSLLLSMWANVGMGLFSQENVKSISVVADFYGFQMEPSGMKQKRFLILFNDLAGEFYLISDKDTKCILVLYISDIASLRDVFIKYLEWEKIVIKNKVEIVRELADHILISSRIYDHTYKEYQGDGISLDFIFYSETVDKHYLVIVDDEDYWINYESFLEYPIYLNSPTVKSLINSLSEEHINYYMKKHNDNVEMIFD